MNYYMKKIKVDYSNPYNYEYLIKNYIAKLLPIKINESDWKSATLEHMTNTKDNDAIKTKKFQEDIKIINDETKCSIIFSSVENKLTVILNDFNKRMKITGDVKYIHSALINIPIEHKKNVFSKQYVDAMYKCGIQFGICSYLQTLLVGIQKNMKETITNLDNRGVLFYNILDKFEEWSLKTYEGETISHGFLLDRSSKETIKNYDFKYLDLLQRNEFAPLIDLPFSLFKIDQEGNILKYLSHNTSNKNLDYPKFYHPLNLREYFDLCNTESSKKKYISIALLKKSEIIIAIDNQVNWVKRNGNWHNYNFIYFNHTLKNYNNSLNFSNINKLFSFTISVSFAKKGGCIAIIDLENKKEFLKKFNVNNWFDNLSMTKSNLLKRLDKLTNPLEKEFYNKKIEKLDILKKIANNNFYSLDERLLLELSSMDGAIIIDSNGKILAISSIVDLKKRGEGGGRSAAAKTLSEYGIAIKISEDGYVEMYYEEKIIYSIK